MHCFFGEINFSIIYKVDMGIMTQSKLLLGKLFTNNTNINIFIMTKKQIQFWINLAENIITQQVHQEFKIIAELR